MSSQEDRVEYYKGRVKQQEEEVAQLERELEALKSQPGTSRAKIVKAEVRYIRGRTMLNELLKRLNESEL